MACWAGAGTKGYSMPRPGIYIRTPHRRHGASRLLMNYLQFAARLKGAKAVQIERVHRTNERAFRLLLTGLTDSKESGEERSSALGRLPSCN